MTSAKATLRRFPLFIACALAVPSCSGSATHAMLPAANAPMAASSVGRPSATKASWIYLTDREGGGPLGSFVYTPNWNYLGQVGLDGAMNASAVVVDPNLNVYIGSYAGWITMYHRGDVVPSGFYDMREYGYGVNSIAVGAKHVYASLAEDVPGQAPSTNPVSEEIGEVLDFHLVDTPNETVKPRHILRVKGLEPTSIGTDRNGDLLVEWVNAASPSAGVQMIDYPAGSASGKVMKFRPRGSGAFTFDSKGDFLFCDTFNERLSIYPPSKTTIFKLHPSQTISLAPTNCKALALDANEKTLYVVTGTVTVPQALAVYDYPSLKLQKTVTQFRTPHAQISGIALSPPDSI